MVVKKQALGRLWGEDKRNVSLVKEKTKEIILTGKEGVVSSLTFVLLV